MKRILKAFMIVVVMVLSGSLYNQTKAQVSASISFQTFYDELSPYGDWIQYPEYGYVWSPGSRYRDFHPYRSEGHWVWTDDYEWMWVSDYDWGWAPFHYGRWHYDSYYGWIWVPDYEWSPAWVVWRSGDGYYGWAPMSPGININLYFGRYTPSYDYWCFAPTRYITSSRISNYYVDARQNTTIINNTTVINNYSTRNSSYRTGPSRQEAERYTGSEIRSANISESRNPGRTRVRNNEVAIYKPSIDRQSAGNDAPKRFERYNRNGVTDRTNNDGVERRSNVEVDVRRERNGSERRIENPNADQAKPDINRNNDRRLNRRQTDRQTQQEERVIENKRQQQERRTFPSQQSERPNRQDVRPDESRQPMEKRIFENRQPQEQRPQQRTFPSPQIERPNRSDVRPNENGQPQQERRVFENRQQPQEQRTFPSPQNERPSRPDVRPNEKRLPQQQSQYQNRGNQQTVPQQTQGNNGNGRGRGNGRNG